MSKELQAALATIPSGLRYPLISEFTALLSEYSAGDWEKVGLKAGKLCEVVYTVLESFVAGKWASAPSKPKNMVDACKALEHAGATFSRSVKIQIPRILIATYELRNNRAIGHVGGEVDPNHMDAEFFLRSGKWMMAELIRIFDDAHVEHARLLIAGVTSRTLPVVWDAGARKRVLNPKMTYPDQVLVLLYGSTERISARTLLEWTGYTNPSRFVSSVLKKLDAAGLIDLDSDGNVRISPTGIREVESRRLLEL